VLGDVVNTAARLMMATPPSTIVVSQAARQPCADLFIWELLTVFRLVQARDQTEPDFYQGALSGREPELERL
jgi:class 3 adenylate cyclase